MGLRQQTSTLILLTAVALIIIHLIIGYGVIADFSRLEESSVQRDINRAVASIYSEQSTLDQLVRNWAHWDDTYNFMEKPNQQYVDRNLADHFFSDMKINLILFVNNDGLIAYGKAFDLKNNMEIPIPESIREHIYPGSPITDRTNSEGEMRGIISLGENVMLFSSRPILTSTREGPSHGTLLMGRYIDEKEVERLSKEKNLTLSFYRVDDKNIPEDFRNEIKQLSGGETAFIQPLSGDSIAGYRLLEDIYGRPAVVLGVQVSRGVYSKSVAGITFFAISTIITCALAGAGIIIIIERTVLKPLEEFCEQLNEIGQGGDLSARLTVSGKDEFSNAARTVNSMLDELEKSQKKLHTEHITAIGQAATMTAHDLRNPLQVLVNSIYLAKQDLENLPPEYADWATRQKQRLNDMERQVGYMDKIVSDLHYYGTSVDQELSPVDMRQLVVDILKATDVPRDIEVSIVQEPGLPRILVNPPIIRRVLSNLVMNAIQAMPNGGRLTVRLYRTKDDLYVSVEDTGVGISQENMDKIFQPLFTTKAKGQGLGLAVSKRLVESQGGTISVESQEGKGSIFTVRIPIKEASGDSRQSSQQNADSQ